MKTQWIIICALIFALITAIFAVANVEPVPVDYVFGTSQIPLILVILGAALLGGLVVGLYGITLQYRLQRKIRQLNKTLLEQEETGGEEAGSVAISESQQEASDPEQENPADTVGGDEEKQEQPQGAEERSLSDKVPENKQG